MMTEREPSTEPENGRAGPFLRPPEPSAHYAEGVAAAETLLRILASSSSTHGALRQAVHEVMLRGRADMLAGFLDTLQERLTPPQEDRDD